MGRIPRVRELTGCCCCCWFRWSMDGRAHRSRSRCRCRRCRLIDSSAKSSRKNHTIHRARSLHSKSTLPCQPRCCQNVQPATASRVKSRVMNSLAYALAVRVRLAHLLAGIPAGPRHKVWRSRGTIVRAGAICRLTRPLAGVALAGKGRRRRIDRARLADGRSGPGRREEHMGEQEHEGGGGSAHGSGDERRRHRD